MGGNGTEVEGEGVTHSSSWWESTVEETKKRIRTNNNTGFQANVFPEVLLLRSLVRSLKKKSHSRSHSGRSGGSFHSALRHPVGSREDC